MTRQHVHLCDCGQAWIVCTEDLDKCQVVEPWECQTCIDRQLDVWLDKEMKRREHEHALALTKESR